MGLSASGATATAAEVAPAESTVDEDGLPSPAIGAVARRRHPS